jgi:hypothetical protein
MSEPKDMIVPMLRKIDADMNRRFDSVDKRLDRIEEKQKSYSQALSADSMMSKLVTGDFEQRILALDEKVDALTKARQ